MKKYLKLIQKNRLFVGSGVEDIYDSNVRTSLDDFGQYYADYGSARKESITKILNNSDDSLSEAAISRGLYSGLKNIKYEKNIGYYLALYAGHVLEGTYRSRGSSGGLVTWLSVELMKRGEIDGLIHVKRSDTPGILFEYGISRSLDEIKLGAKSRYYPVELSKVLKSVIDNPGNYAVVGIPEIITELRLLSMYNKKIAKSIKYYFGLVCGHQKTTRYAEAIAWEYGIKPGDLIDIDFRRKNKTGTAIDYDMRFTGLVKGEKLTFSVKNTEPFISNWGQGFFKARFSDFTNNAFNELSDVTFGDAWLENYNQDPKGNNILIVRNKKILKIIKESTKLNKLKLDEVTEETIINSQKGLMNHTVLDLPYRLYKEIKRSGWAPKKSAKPSNLIPRDRKMIQDARQNISEKSHTYYRKAREMQDFGYFVKKMTPLVNHYKKLYNEPIYKKSKKNNYDGAILTLTGYHNYGNVIQRYALQKFLRKNGYNFVSYLDNYSIEKVLYKIDAGIIIKTPIRAAKRFIKGIKPYWYIPKYGDLYPSIRNKQNLIYFVNKNIATKAYNPLDKYVNYIVGSDQVWRNWWGRREPLGYYFFSFLKGQKANRVSYAASFGKDNIKDVMTRDDIDYISPYVSQLDAISVRESSAVKILKGTWGVKDVSVVVDPTLLITKNEYSELIDKSNAKNKTVNPIFTYILEGNKEIDSFIYRIKKDLKLQTTSVIAHSLDDDYIMPEVEYWLKGFRDSRFVITNSFHGMIFSILNNTDFIVISREEGGSARIKDFLRELDLSYRMVDENNLKTFDINSLKPINWEKVEGELNKLIEKSSQWLLDSLIRTKKLNTIKNSFLNFVKN